MVDPHGLFRTYNNHLSHYSQHCTPTLGPESRFNTGALNAQAEQIQPSTSVMLFFAELGDGGWRMAMVDGG
jgi:hypothetical protein